MSEEENSPQNTFIEISELVANLHGDIDLLTVSSKKLQEQLGKRIELTAQLENLKRNAIENADQIKELNKRLEENQDYVNELVKVHSQLNDAKKDLKKSTESLNKTYSDYNNNVTRAMSTFNRWLPMFGGQSITIRGAKDALTKYNQSMFGLSRTYQVLGSGTQNFAKAFDTVRTSTTLSKNQFLDFAKTATSAWQGVRPGIDTLAELSSVIQSRLGPDIDQLNAGLSTLTQIMEKMPSVGQTMSQAMLAVRNNSDGAERLLNTSRAHLEVLARTGQISVQEYEKSLKMLSKTTDQQEEQIDLNRQLAETAQKFEDAMLQLGQQMEPLLKSISSGLSTMAGILGTMPLQVLAIGTAFKNMSIDAVAAMANVKTSVKGATAQVINLNAQTAARSTGGGKALGVGGPLLMAGLAGLNEYSTRRNEGHSKGHAGVSATASGIGVIGAAKLGAKLGAKKGIIGGPKGSAVGGLIGAGIGMVAAPMISNMFHRGGPRQNVEDKKEEERVQSQINDQMSRYTLSLIEARQNYKNIIDFANENLSILQKEVDLMKEVGMLDYGARSQEYFDRIIGSISRSRDAAEEFFKFLSSVESIRTLQSLGVDTTQIEGILNNLEGKDLEVFLSSENFGEFESSIRNTMNNLQKETVQIRMELQQDGLDSNQEEALQNRLNEILSSRTILESQLKDIGDARIQVLSSEARIADEIANKWNTASESVQRMNTAYQERLNAERQLMESAQFGMGASLSMMQQQVDMAYELIDVEKQRQQMADHELRTKLQLAELTEQESNHVMSLLKNARSHMHAKQIINNLGLDQIVNERLLLRYAHDQQDATKNIMQQQQRIYELTKDVREGYLDAIREMSTGAGEFEKIIGTQEMGVTQLMDAVNKYTETGQQGMLNTFALGVQQDSNLRHQGVGTSPMGFYSAASGGPTLSFQDRETYNRGLSRYAGYQESIQQHYANLRGEGGRSVVGGSLAMTDGYEGAMREGHLEDLSRRRERNSSITDGFSETLHDIFDEQHYRKSEIAFFNALNRFYGRTGGVGFNDGTNMDIMGGIQPIFRRGGSGAPAAALERQHPLMGVNFGANVARGAQGSLPADPSPFTRRTIDARISALNDYLENILSEQGIEYKGEISDGFNSVRTHGFNSARTHVELSKLIKDFGLDSKIDERLLIRMGAELNQLNNYMQRVQRSGVVNSYSVPTDVFGRNPSQTFTSPSSGQPNPNYWANTNLGRAVQIGNQTQNKSRSMHTGLGTIYFRSEAPEIQTSGFGISRGRRSQSGQERTSNENIDSESSSRQNIPSNVDNTDFLRTLANASSFVNLSRQSAENLQHYDDARKFSGENVSWHRRRLFNVGKDHGVGEIRTLKMFESQNERISNRASLAMENLSSAHQTEEQREIVQLLEREVELTDQIRESTNKLRAAQQEYNNVKRGVFASTPEEIVRVEDQLREAAQDHLRLGLEKDEAMRERQRLTQRMEIRTQRQQKDDKFNAPFSEVIRPKVDLDFVDDDDKIQHFAEHYGVNVDDMRRVFEDYDTHGDEGARISLAHARRVRGHEERLRERHSHSPNLDYMIGNRREESERIYRSEISGIGAEERFQQRFQQGRERFQQGRESRFRENYERFFDESRMRQYHNISISHAASDRDKPFAAGIQDREIYQNARREAFERAIKMSGYERDEGMDIIRRRREQGEIITPERQEQMDQEKDSYYDSFKESFENNYNRIHQEKMQEVEKARQRGALIGDGEYSRISQQAREEASRIAIEEATGGAYTQREERTMARRFMQEAREEAGFDNRFTEEARQQPREVREELLRDQDRDYYDSFKRYYQDNYQEILEAKRAEREANISSGSGPILGDIELAQSAREKAVESAIAQSGMLASGFSEQEISSMAERFMERGREESRSSIEPPERPPERARIATHDYTDEEMELLTHGLRQSIGQMKGSTAQERFQQMNRIFVQDKPWENYSEEQIAQAQEIMRRSAEREWNDQSAISSEQYRSNVATQSFGTKYTSAAEARNQYASQEDQSLFLSQDVQRNMQDLYGTSTSMGEGGGRGGVVEVIVSLSPELQGVINAQGSVIAELQRATSSR